MDFGGGVDYISIRHVDMAESACYGAKTSAPSKVCSNLESLQGHKREFVSKRGQNMRSSNFIKPCDTAYGNSNASIFFVSV